MGCALPPTRGRAELVWGGDSAVAVWEVNLGGFVRVSLGFEVSPGTNLGGLLVVAFGFDGCHGWFGTCFL